MGAARGEFSVDIAAHKLAVGPRPAEDGLHLLLAIAGAAADGGRVQRFPRLAVVVQASGRAPPRERGSP